MESKKDLNNTQRKVLEEIYCGQIDTERKIYRNKRSTDRGAAIKAETDRIMSSPPLKKLFVADEKRSELLKEASEFLEDNGLYFNNTYKLELRYNRGVVPDYDQETEDTLAKYDKAGQEIRAKIWGMDTTYAEIEKEVKAVLESIK